MAEDKRHLDWLNGRYILFMSKTYSSGYASYDKVVAPSRHNTKTIAVEKYLLPPIQDLQPHKRQRPTRGYTGSITDNTAVHSDCHSFLSGLISFSEGLFCTLSRSPTSLSFHLHYKFFEKIVVLFPRR